MQIRGVNLVPADRREARRRRHRFQIWVGACALYAFAWLALHVVVQTTMASDDRALRGEIEVLRADAVRKDAAVNELDLDRRQAIAQLHANLAVGKQPDWSILLALLSATLEDEIVLRSVRLVSQEPVINLDFTGLGHSQAAVSRFVLRLEETALFRSVTLLDTRREPFLAGYAITFRVECVLDAGGGPLP